ncbi:hypothetical protein J4573_33905 [Actinomadura barringtoniae]|uniref:Peptidase M4 C-terminal domain-containing protein n=1 Tax=Actinomadura barringtoniae TaxID=1427535 RepID=A0A939TDB3_9ACTN|nr:hypothetical protein [Actinomadura barringtoniae]MBO2452125.1 hypothetical protein [Actinomadura barringtoniae]
MIHQQDLQQQQELQQQESGVRVPLARVEQLPPQLRVEGAAPPLPQPIPRPIPIPVPVVTGHRVLIYKQDPTVTELGARLTFIPTVILNGPMDARVQVELPGTTPVARNANGDFIFTPNTPQFDCAHTFAVVRETMAMYERLNGGNPIPFAWNVGGNTDRITVFPHAGPGANAFYSRTAKALKFLSFVPQGQPPTAEVFTCRSLDIVSHECGHSVLDGLKPGWLSAAGPPQTGGLHEAFGDLTAVFLALAQPDQAEALVSLTRANLHDRSFLPALAEEFGKAIGQQFGLRNADNDLKLSEVSNEVHAISQVFTGAIYDVLADIYVFERNRQRRTKDPTIVLIEVADKLHKLLFDAIVAAPASAATYVDIANKMLQISAGQSDPANYRTFIRNRFAVREIVTSPTPLTDLMSGRLNMTDADYTGEGGDVTEVAVHDEHSASLRAEQDRSRCCGTMQMPEYAVIDSEKLSKRGPLDNDDILRNELDELRRAFNK